MWIAPLTTSPENLCFLKSILAANELERGRRFRKSSDGERYIVARGSLRTLLGVYLASAPDRLKFKYDGLGKPSLLGQTSEAVLNFNVSHSGNRALFGFARRRRIGVDLECGRPDVDMLGLARRYFSPSEFLQFRGLPASAQCEAFYRAWTRKEAYLKACGEGLSFGPERVEVSFTPGAPAMIRKVAGVRKVSEQWTLKHLAPAPGYVGAAAVEAGNIVFRCFRWESD